MAESRNLGFQLRIDPRLPKSVVTDSKRLQQILKNLLSNAFKFTHDGQVTFSIEAAEAGWGADNDNLNRAPEAVAFVVTDTGIGISGEKQKIIFEAFQQADGSTSRKYGGTGLGLAISRELAKLLGGEITLVSNPGKGSSFILYLPLTYAPSRTSRRSAPPGLIEIEGTGGCLRRPAFQDGCGAAGARPRTDATFQRGAG